MLDALRREGAGWAEAEVREIGRRAGTAQAQDWGRLANENPPVLRTHDRFGHRVDEVEFHPAWHELMNVAIGAGMHAAPWQDPRPGAHVARAAKFYLWGRAEAGHGCPVSMTYAIVPALRNTPALAERFGPLLASAAYDPGLRPPEGKRGLIAGMSMTEKQGGSDVRANTTRAVPVPGDGPAGGPAGAGRYLLTGLAPGRYKVEFIGYCSDAAIGPGVAVADCAPVCSAVPVAKGCETISATAPSTTST